MGQPYSLLVRLAQNSFLVYSPGPGLIDSAMEFLHEDDEVILLAPAAGHTLGLESWSRRFRNSFVVASAVTKEKLLKKTALATIQAPEDIGSRLPEHVSIHVLPDNRLGEIWISIASGESNGTIYWAVCDAFMNLDKISGSLFSRIFMKLYGLKTGLLVHRVFKHGVKDPAEFRQWALERFPNKKKNIFIPCHGEVYSQDDLANRIASLVKDNF